MVAEEAQEGTAGTLWTPIGWTRTDNKQERWERRQRRHRKRAGSEATRPSLSSSRNNSSGKSLNEKGIEKGPIAPVPVLLKHAHNSPAKSEQAYGHNTTVQHHDQPNPYPSQPHIDQPHPTDLGHPIQPSMSDLSTTPLTASRTDEPPISKPSKPSRSVARVAAAEKAAANSLADPNSRYQPKKPSPLALAAEKKANEARGMSHGHGPSRSRDANAQESLTVPGDNPYSGNDGQKARSVVSGEWGVALGSPDNDGSFAAQQRYSAGPNRYSSDPYLGAPDTKRAPSGHYSSDPYAAYHDTDDERDHYPLNGETASTKGNWV